MSASSKKKLRKEQNAAQLTEKQLQQQKEDKKLKNITTIFVVVMALVLVIALATAGMQMFNNSGINQRNTLALTVNEHELNNADLNYFYIDGINRFYSDWYNQYGNYAAMYLQMYGLDLTKPLNEQYYGFDSTQTWADYFVNMAIADATNVYAQYDKAMEAGFQLDAALQENLNTSLASLKESAKDGNFSSVNKYLQAFYGPGSSEESYTEYLTATVVATAFAGDHYSSLEFTAADIRAYDDEHASEFNSYTYAAYYLSATDFRQGGTKNEDGTTTYTDEEKAAAVEAAKAAADALLAHDTRTKLDLAIGDLEINAEKEDVKSTYYENQAYDSVTDTLREWVTDPARVDGEMGVVPSISTAKNADGTETTTTNGYYVVLFENRNDNVTKLVNVRHLLVEFEGGSNDSEGNKVYTKEEKAAAKSVADGLLNEWKLGEATEQSFSDLVLLNTDDTASAATGGLYENIYAGSGYVEAFENWALAEGRNPGDVEIIETPYGYHIMYFVSTNELNLRDFMINNALESEAMDAWYTEVREAAKVSDGDTKYLKRDLTLMGSY